MSTIAINKPLSTIDETEFDAVVAELQGRIGRGLSLGELHRAAGTADEWLARVPLAEREGAVVDYFGHVVPTSYRGDVEGIGATLAFKDGQWLVAEILRASVPHRSYSQWQETKVRLARPIDRNLVDRSLRSKHWVTIPTPEAETD